MNADRHLQQLIGKARLTPISDLAEQIIHPSPSVRREADREARKRLGALQHGDPIIAKRTQALLHDLHRCRRPTMHLGLRLTIALSVALGVYLVTGAVTSDMKHHWDTFYATYTDRDVLIWGLATLALLWTLLRTSRG